jgi:hypothetical protein
MRRSARGIGRSYAANAVMNPENAQRLVDTLSEAQKYPQRPTNGSSRYYAFFDMVRRNLPVLIRSSRLILTLFAVFLVVVPIANTSFIGVQ